MLSAVCCLLASLVIDTAEAAVSKGRDTQLESSSTNQGGGLTTSANFRQHGAIGEIASGARLSSPKFRVTPGFLGATLASSTSNLVPLSELDLTVLYAKTDALGVEITPQAWQRDADPIFIWEAPATGADMAGYSYAVDADPDDIVDTMSLSFNVAASTLRTLSDGKHTFSVKAVNTAGNAGKPIALELWVDTQAPQVVTYAPSPGLLLNTRSPAVSITVSDLGSGVDPTNTKLLINGSSTSASFNEATGVITTTGGAWKEGVNTIELRALDLIGNAQTPLVWSLTIDTTPPAGTVTINTGSEMTTSIYVTLGFSASDAISGVASILVSNEELTGYVEESYATLREFWKLSPLRGSRSVFVKFKDRAGNISKPVSDAIELWLIAPETVITSGPAGFTPDRAVSFAFMCPEGGCLFSFAFDNETWSEWSAATSVERKDLLFGNHYFRVKAAKDVNGTSGIQLDEEDPAPAERTWIVGTETPMLNIPRGPVIKLWRLE